MNTSSMVVTDRPKSSTPSSALRASTSRSSAGNWPAAPSGSWKATSEPTSLSTLAGGMCILISADSGATAQPLALMHVRL